MPMRSLRLTFELESWMSLAQKNPEYDWNHLVTEICNEVSKLTGNVMADKQRPMVESRMKRRCLELHFNSAEEYKSYWQKNLESENKVLIGLLTTHFTSFFREFLHFEWIANELPSLVAAAKKEGRTTLKFWSAASSKGQEVWSLCMWLHHHLPKIDPSMKWVVHGSDIDSVSVKEGENGVYHRRELETAPRHLWEGLWIRGKGEISDWYKVKSELKEKAQFQTQNLLKLTVPTSEKYDVIMCRNVLIYFDRPNQELIVNSLLKYLTPQGALITGMSESLSGYGFSIRGVAPSVYKHATAAAAPAPVMPVKEAPVLMPVPLKVLCVDDSPTVISILKKILKAPEFEIIATAANGQEALDILTVQKPDVITLDLHMPVMDGPTFLKTSGIASTIPVIIVSSVDREHAPLTGPLEEMGVIDFVEKPTLGNINDIADELSQKLKMGWVSKKKNHRQKREDAYRPTSSYGRSGGHIIFNFGQLDEKNVLHVLNEQKWTQDELSFYSFGSLNPAFKEQILKLATSARKINFYTVGDRVNLSTSKTVWLLFNGANTYAAKTQKRREDFLVLDEQIRDGELKEQADDILLPTSFSYLVDKLLGGK